MTPNTTEQTPRRITNEEFDAHLESIVSKMTAASILSYGGVYEVLSEELNNAVIEAWEQETLRERLEEARTLGCNAGKHDATHDGNTENPYGMDTESVLHAAWEEEYENEYEAAR